MRVGFVIERLLVPMEWRLLTWLEVLLLPALAMALALSLHPDDPFFSESLFPWPLLAPLLVALRYGPVAGVLGVGVLLLIWLGVDFALQPLGRLPQQYFLGATIMVMVAGEFTSLANNRMRRALSMQRYLQQRFDFLRNQHYLLRLSHDRLEHDLIGRPMSLRDALECIRALPADDATGGLPGVDELFRLLAQYCQIESAALVPVRNGALRIDQAHFLGEAFDIDRGDDLFAYACERDVLCHVAADDPSLSTSSRYLAVAPIHDLEQTVHGWLVVARMPFFALHEETLQMVNLMLGYYGDGVARQRLAAPLLEAEARLPLDFAVELQRLWHARRSVGLCSALVGLSFTPREGFDDLPLQIKRLARLLDATWLISDGHEALFLTLMPLANIAAAAGYQARIERWLHERYQTDLTTAGVVTRIWLIDEIAPSRLLANILEECRVTDLARTVVAAA